MIQGNDFKLIIPITRRSGDLRELVITKSVLKDLKGKEYSITINEVLGEYSADISGDLLPAGKYSLEIAGKLRIESSGVLRESKCRRFLSEALVISVEGDGDLEYDETTGVPVEKTRVITL